jgi:predicted nucleotidyltransferase
MFSFEKKAMKRITRKLEELLGNNLIAVLVFGSRVRGDFSAESDFDILVVVKKRTFGIIDTVNEVLSEEEDKTGIPFSVVVKGMESFERERKYNTSFYRNIKKEGIILHGSAQR